MILIFSEDGGLAIADDLTEVQRHCEGLDVASSVPNERFASMEQVKMFLRARGAPVDRPADIHRAAD
jgi:hypothetical protein